MKFGFLAVMALLCFSLALGHAKESEDPNDVSIEIQGPLEAQDNTTTPPTVKVLGITFAVSIVDDSSKLRSRKNGSDDPPVVPPVVTVGQTVKLELSSDAAPLTARELKDVTAYDTNVKVKAPLQAVDTVLHIVTLLGLTVDISTATVDGANDDHSSTTAIDAASLTVGQNVEIVLDATKLPALVATTIEVRNFSNKVSLHIEKEHGVEIENEVEAIHVEIEQHISVTDSTGHKSKKTIHVETETHNGSLDLSGLSPGVAKVTLTRKGRIYHKTVKVSANGSKLLKIKVKG